MADTKIKGSDVRTDATITGGYSSNYPQTEQADALKLRPTTGSNITMNLNQRGGNDDLVIDLTNGGSLTLIADGGSGHNRLFLMAPIGMESQVIEGVNPDGSQTLRTKDGRINITYSHYDVQDVENIAPAKTNNSARGRIW